MTNDSSATEAVVRNHLEAFQQHRGIDAILSDYAEDASFLSESRVYQGKAQIRDFFEGFMRSLPPGGAERFELHSLRAAGDVAQITWSVGSDWPLGTDTFVVKDGKIAAQSCAIYVSNFR